MVILLKADLHVHTINSDHGLNPQKKSTIAVYLDYQEVKIDLFFIYDTF